MKSSDLNLLAHELAARGFAGHDATIDAVSRAALAAGASPVLVAVLADPGEPEVARLRAFGKVASRLAGYGAPQARQHEPAPRRLFGRRRRRPDTAAA